MKTRWITCLAVLLVRGLSQSAAQSPPEITSAGKLDDGSFLLFVQGSPGQTYRIVASERFNVWDTIAVQMADASFGDLVFRDRAALFFGARYYGLGLAVGDTTFPNFTLTSPTNELVNQPALLLAGTASDSSGIREVRINANVIAGTTNFSAPLPLTPGTNRFLLSVIDLSPNRNRRSQIVQVRYVPAVPAILLQPTSQTNLVTTTATFNVSATGTEPLYYQWRKEGVALADGPRVSGATTPVLAIGNVGAADAAGYEVVVTNATGAVTSQVATLTVSTPPGWIGILQPQFTENFDELGAAGTNLPAGWYVGTGNGAIAGTNVTASAGSSTGGGNYNFGTAGSSERALGSLAASSTPRNTEARFMNASGSNLVSLTIDYAGEQWRQGGTVAVDNDLVLHYSVNGTNFTAMGGQFDFHTPYDTGPAGALDGNQATNRVAGIGGFFVPPAAITNGGAFYLRWVDADNSSSDHGIALDDLTITFTFESAP